MRKITLSFIAAGAAMMIMSCGNSTPKADLKNDVDTLSYAIGMANTQGFKGLLVQNGVDTAYMDEFYKGVIQGANAGDDKKRTAYYAGIQVGQMIANGWVKGANMQIYGNDSTKSVSLKNMIAGFITGVKGEKGIMTPEQAGMLAQMKMQAIKAAENAKQYGPNKKASEKFMANYAKGKDVKKLSDGIYYKVIKEGKGEVPKDTSLVTVNYELKDIKGKVLESSYERKQPVDFRANQVIPGWTKALTHMPVGSVWEVAIPQDQAYGENGNRDIEPYSALVFKIELVGIK